MSSIEAEYQEWLACPAMPEELQEELRTMDGLQKNDSLSGSLLRCEALRNHGCPFFADAGDPGQPLRMF